MIVNGEEVGMSETIGESAVLSGVMNRLMDKIISNTNGLFFIISLFFCFIVASLEHLKLF